MNNEYVVSHEAVASELLMTSHGNVLTMTNEVSSPNGALDADDAVPARQVRALGSYSVQQAVVFDSSNVRKVCILYETLYFYPTLRILWIFSKCLLQKYEVNDGSKGLSWSEELLDCCETRKSFMLFIIIYIIMCTYTYRTA
jgi:hypothetical protein